MKGPAAHVAALKIGRPLEQSNSVPIRIEGGPS